MLKYLRQFELKEKRVLMRVDFNVPLKDGIVTDDFRIRSVLPTINYCLKSGASLVLMSHLGRPNGKVMPEFSLIPIGETLAGLLEMPIKFSHDCVSEDAHDTSLSIKPGEIHLLENLRFYSGEISNDKEFSALLARHGQIYINDAFGTAHRAHASNVGVASHFTFCGVGLLFEKEWEYLNNVLRLPNRPLTLILGGAKISGKIQLINRFIEEADHILIGGGMAFTFLKAQGQEVGGSLVDDSMLRIAQRILQKAKNHKVTMQFPSDVLIAKNVNDVDNIKIVRIDQIPDDWEGLDIGPETVTSFNATINDSKTVIWNGPMGVFETTAFQEGTSKIADALAQLHAKGNIAIVGGGDTAAAIRQFNLMESVSHVSTGGGASLELLSGNRLPSIEALEK
ncbi:phosphoglycerate kinase [Candidatus Neomarinimicrobiota bacterium]